MGKPDRFNTLTREERGPGAHALDSSLEFKKPVNKITNDTRSKAASAVEDPSMIGFKSESSKARTARRHRRGR